MIWSRALASGDNPGQQIGSLGVLGAENHGEDLAASEPRNDHAKGPDGRTREQKLAQQRIELTGVTVEIRSRQTRESSLAERHHSHVADRYRQADYRKNAQVAFGEAVLDEEIRKARTQSRQEHDNAQRQPIPQQSESLFRVKTRQENLVCKPSRCLGQILSALRNIVAE